VCWWLLGPAPPQGHVVDSSQGRPLACEPLVPDDVKLGALAARSLGLADSAAAVALTQVSQHTGEG
jgi:hypothetical protein